MKDYIKTFQIIYNQKLMQIYEMNIAKRNQIKNFIKNYFISEIDVNLII